MYGKFLIGAVGAAVLAAASPASALVWTSNLEYRDMGGAGPTVQSPFGVVQIEDGFDGGTTVRVTVSLTNPKSLFINTGGPHEPFLYNLASAAQVKVVNAAGQNFYDGGRTDPGAFEATPFGKFTNKVGCCGDWIEGQNVVSGFHWQDVTTSEQVLVGYKISGYEIKGYEIKGYEPKLDKNGKPVFDKNGQPVYDKSKPIYDQTKPIYKTKTTTKKTKVLDYTYVPGHWVERNGAANGISGPLEFYLKDDAGLTFAGLNFNVDPATGQLQLPLGTGNHFFSNAGGWWFTADIYDGVTGQTYNVAAKDAYCAECRVTAVPEPATWGLMILGFGAAGAVLRTRRRLAQAV
jgi:hypothetical protein